ncbi:polysaccharide lyase family 7 protein [Reinekea marinisedimentorum]|uniref:Ricin-type beta-trefoil lectin protein n=1 Tax=Reinekea marinisedimentorum TaxID=230495 RepID=A0A4R3HV05_9GAMM|nr:polysaccharide lyase family 7 protein [Reinekea marinisedimentorum]TCS35875.1 ricin-type beta-trefoil lectin protein [Reinekea marinisedimentorum]
MKKILTISALALSISAANAATFVIEKQGTSFAMDGGSGSEREGNTAYIWETDDEMDNENQWWVQYDRGDGYYSYKKYGTSLCLDGGEDGSDGQEITLEECDADNYDQHWEKVKVTSGTEIYRFIKRNDDEHAIYGGEENTNKLDLTLTDEDDDDADQYWELFNIDTDSVVDDEDDDSDSETDSSTTPDGYAALITDSSSSDTGELRLNLGNGYSEGTLSVDVKMSSDETETAYIGIYGESGADTAYRMAELKLDDSYSDYGDSYIGVRLRDDSSYDSSTLTSISADAWTNFTVAWDLDSATYSVEVDGTELGYFNLIESSEDVQYVAIKLSTNSGKAAADYPIFIDNIDVSSGSDSVFFDDFESYDANYDLSSDDNYDSKSFSVTVVDPENLDEVDDGNTDDTDDGSTDDTDDSTGTISDFDWDGWKVTLPVNGDTYYDDGNTDSAAEILPMDEESGEQCSEDVFNEDLENDYFWSDSEGLHFKVPMNLDGKTPNTSYIRSELRELYDWSPCETSSEANWAYGGDHTLEATLRMDDYNEDTTKVVIGQIHGHDISYATIKLHWEGDDKPIRVIYNETPEESSSESVYLGYVDASDFFSYTIKMTDEGIELTAGGVTETIKFGEELDDAWTDETFYFKAGLYPQEEPDEDSSDVYEATFSSVTVTHSN